MATRPGDASRLDRVAAESGCLSYPRERRFLAARPFRVPRDPNSAAPRSKKDRFVLALKTCNVPDPLCPPDRELAAIAIARGSSRTRARSGLRSVGAAPSLFLDGIPGGFRRQGALEWSRGRQRNGGNDG